MNIYEIEYDLVGRADKIMALDGITLKDGTPFYPIKEGEFVMIRGPSGGGKTTLLNMFGTIDDPSSGTISMLDNEIHNLKSDSKLSELRLSKIGFVFQTFNLLATMTAYENVELPMSLLGKLSTK